MTKFNGTFDKLTLLVHTTGIPGSWRDSKTKKQFRADSGAVMNWWPSTGTISFQGPAVAAEVLEVAFCNASTTEGDAQSVVDTRRENTELRRQLLKHVAEIQHLLALVLEGLNR